MSVATEIQELTQNTAELDGIRTSMREKLVAKGVDASTHNFADFPNDVESISASEAVITAYYCGANATVTATLGNDTYTATADGDGTANIFVGKTGTYTISSTGTTVVKNCIVSATHTFVYIEMTDAQSIVAEAVFYTDFRGRATNLNNNAEYSISSNYILNYTAAARKTLNASGPQFVPSNSFKSVINTTNSPMTIMLILNITTGQTYEVGARVFDFLANTYKKQGVVINGTSVRGFYNNNSAGEVTNISYNSWFALCVRKNQSATAKDVSVYNGTFSHSSFNDTANYADGIYIFKNDSNQCIQAGTCAGLLCWNRYLTDDEVKQVSAYLIADAE